ncbi:MAG: valine--tRNA ligase [Firmicutes bacterium]|nr:valine--tRNA ligase [Bacillota bacterium]MDY3659224.1 valine--tRNA ligase [Eubacteriales bacterium]
MLDNKYNFSESEPKWQKFWQDEEVYKFDSKSDKEVFSIDSPPPTVSGKIHIGHIFSYSQADFVARFKRMCGYNTFYPFGFDDNGLPTERLVEKEFGIKAHEVSREEFRDKCMQVAEKYEQDFKNLFISAGNSADFSLCYSTVSPEVQKSSQRSFIDLVKAGEAYYGERPAIWCPECRISIAQAELESKDIESSFNHLKFNLADGSGYLEIATTRPEMLCACVCVFVNPEDERYKKFVGKKVIVPLYNFEVEVLTDEKASIDKGTGVVMCCTYGDETDLFWQEKYKLPRKIAIDDGGRMTALSGKYVGMKTKVARSAIVEDLKQAGLLIKQEPIVHAVATHERCGTPMEINIKKQWFIKLVEHKDEFLKRGNEINWYPEFMKSRYTNWVENVDRDWCISRQRYFGVPIPVWYCEDCGEIILPDDDQLPVNPLIDKPKHACPKCGSQHFKPETDIFDTWQTSSITPQLNCRWKTDDQFYNKMMPMSLRPNAHDIIRTWDFYTIAKSHFHSDCLPWKNVMVSGFVMANKDEKISKSKSNAKMSPEILLKEKSADITRYWAATGSLGRDIIFSDEEFKNGAKLVNKIWNASRFVISLLDGYSPKDIELKPMDEWVIAKFNDMFDKFKDYFEKYEIGLAMGELEKFFWNFCDNYIEIVKRRLYNPDIFGQEATDSAKFASYNVLLGMLKLFAIYLPHMTEEIYQSYFREFEKTKSIHLCEIGRINKQTSKDVIIGGDEAVQIVSKIRQFKSENNLSLKEELEKVRLVGFGDFVSKIDYDLKAVGSIRNLEFADGEKDIIIEK